jgi:hypothetical protein
MNLTFPGIPSAQPFLFDGHPAVFAEVLVPAALSCAITGFHHSWPIRYAGHCERLPVGLCKEIGEDDKGNVTGASVAPIVRDLLFGSRGLCELRNENGDRILAVSEDFVHDLSRTILDAAFALAPVVVELRERVPGSFALRTSRLCDKQYDEDDEHHLRKRVPTRHGKMLHR